MKWRNNLCVDCENKRPLCNKDCDKIRQSQEKRRILNEGSRQRSLMHALTKPERHRTGKTVIGINHENKTRGLY